MSFFFTPSSWQYDTSRETSGSVAALTGASGTLYFANSQTGRKMHVDYKYGALGVSKGAALNFAQSFASTPSGQIGSIELGPFTSESDVVGDIFPCFGMLICIGATAGIFSPSFFPSDGACVCLWMFGMIPPKAVFLNWGQFFSALPSAGPAVGFVDFGAAEADDQYLPLISDDSVT